MLNISHVNPLTPGCGLGGLCDRRRDAALFLFGCVLLDVSGGGAALPYGGVGLQHDCETPLSGCCWLRSPRCYCCCFSNSEFGRIRHPAPVRFRGTICKSVRVINMSSLFVMLRCLSLSSAVGSILKMVSSGASMGRFVSLLL